MFGLIEDMAAVLGGEKSPLNFLTDQAANVIATPIKIVDEVASKVIEKVME